MKTKIMIFLTVISALLLIVGTIVHFISEEDNFFFTVGNIVSSVGLVIFGSELVAWLIILEGTLSKKDELAGRLMKFLVLPFFCGVLFQMVLGTILDLVQFGAMFGSTIQNGLFYLESSFSSPIFWFIVLIVLVAEIATFLFKTPKNKTVS